MYGSRYSIRHAVISDAADLAALDAALPPPHTVPGLTEGGGKVRKKEKRWWHDTSHLSLDAALVLDDLIKLEAHFCAIATPCPRAPTSRNPFVCRCSVWLTPEEPYVQLVSGIKKTGILSLAVVS